MTFCTLKQNESGAGHQTSRCSRSGKGWVTNCAPQWQHYLATLFVIKLAAAPIGFFFFFFLHRFIYVFIMIGSGRETVLK